MQSNRLIKDLELIDKAIRTCPEILADVQKPICSHDDAISFMATMFTDGMRICKYRRKIEQIKPMNSDVAQAKAKAISAIDTVIENILDMIHKTFNTVKENVEL